VTAVINLLGNKSTQILIEDPFSPKIRGVVQEVRAMKGWFWFGLIFVSVLGCGVSRPKEERIPITSERIAELKQLCLSAGKFTVEAPEGWRPIPSPRRGMVAVSSPHSDNDSILYAHAVAKSSQESLDQFIEADIELLNRENPFLVAAESDPVAVPSAGGAATIKYLEGDSSGARSLVAYIDEGVFVGVIGLSSRQHEAIDQSIGLFEKVVQSYRPLRG